MASNPNTAAVNDQDSQERYLRFVLDQSMYATPLLSIKEVVKNNNLKPLPLTPNYVSGMLNVRGQVISVTDLRKKLNLKPNLESSGIIIVVETPGGLAGALVDEIESVIQLGPKDIDKNPLFEGKQPFFIGVGKTQAGMITLLDLVTLLNPANG